MKSSLSFLAALAALFSSAGCVTQGTGKSNLPRDWLAAMPQAGAPAADIAGVFMELGEQLDGRFTGSGTVGEAKLSPLLFLKREPKVVSWQPTPGATVELRRVDDTHVELIKRVADAVTSRDTLEVEFEKDSGAMAQHGAGAGAHPLLLSAGYGTQTFRLWRAPDGRLYASRTASGVGVWMGVPSISSSEVWCRWDPATPEAVRKQVATEEHNRELDRRIPAVGATAPPFHGADVLTRRPVTSADYAGKVVVLHFWTTFAPSTQRIFLNPLRAVYEKDRDRGLEIVGICLNPARQQKIVADFIKSNDLAWPQLYDGKGKHGEVYEAYFGSGLSSPSYCVIDRRSHVAVFAWGPDQLQREIAQALAAP